VFFLTIGCAGGGSYNGPSADKPVTVRVSRGEHGSGTQEKAEQGKTAGEEKSDAGAGRMDRLTPYSSSTQREYTRRQAEPRFSKEKKVSVAVDGMSLSRFITYVFTDVFERDFVIDPAISERELEKTVTLSLEKEITENRFYNIKYASVAALVMIWQRIAQKNGTH